MSFSEIGFRGGQKWILEWDDASLASPNTFGVFSLFVGELLMVWLIILCVVFERTFLFRFLLYFYIIIYKNPFTQRQIRPPHSKLSSSWLLVDPWTTKMPGAYSEIPHSHRLTSKAISVLRGIGLKNGSPKAEEVQIRKINRKMSTQRRPYYQRWAPHDSFVTKFCCCEKTSSMEAAGSVGIGETDFGSTTKSYTRQSHKALNMLKAYVYLYSNGLWLIFFYSYILCRFVLDSNWDAKIEDVEIITNVSKKRKYSHATFKVRYCAPIVL